VARKRENSAADRGECAPDPAEIRARLQREIYGWLPTLPAPAIVDRELLPARRLEAVGCAERWSLALAMGGEVSRFGLILLLPRSLAPRGIILSQLFQRGPKPLHRIEAALESAGAEITGFKDVVVRAILGRHILAPPFEMALECGYGLALFCPGEVVPDHRARAAAACERFGAGLGDEKPGALACWAALTSAVRAALRQDERVAGAPIVAAGHSRHGKSALLAAAFDADFAGVIAHQSGRFGAALTQGAAGESPRAIARGYPHWFSPKFVRQTVQALPTDLDQHHLLGLVAPRPMLLGNGRLDFWADPDGVYRAARAASAAYLSQGLLGLTQANSPSPDYGGGIVYFLRDGGHGVGAADWRHFVGFLDAKFGPRGSQSKPASEHLSALGIDTPSLAQGGA
jgi:(4-O-methyl)-D-glucuronate---lignin esterase